MDDVEKQKKAMLKDIDAYKALAKVNQSDELNAFMELLVNTAVSKITHAFTNKDAIKSFEDFVELRAEVTSYLYPVQEVKGASAAANALKKQFNEWYGVDNQ